MKDTKSQKRSLLSPAFLICAGLLAAAGGGKSVAIRKFGLYLKKEPLPLKKSLDLLDEQGLGPFQVVPDGKRKIENQEIVKELGTEDYIQWILEDTEAPEDSPVRRVMLFITYYERPDKVPHVPEECYTGGGFQRLATDGVTFEIDKPGLERVPGRYLVFGSTRSGLWQRARKFPVLYLFRVNGEYAGSRDEARIALNKNLFGKYSYFCKAELVFSQASISPSKAEAVQASERLLAVILPILEKEHWPDFKR
ncbi:MAG: exosortase-associated EpsI family protein [Phycisphaerales bacterium]|nr:MAG: exosortase-associated EpsI family protein [Phycisphaerales bacterium]